MNRFNSLTHKSLARFFPGFFRREDGLITVEAVLVLPMLFLSMWLSFNFYESYRQSGRNIKAAYALADIVSRERNAIDATYVDTLYDLMGTIVSERSDLAMRITYLQYNKKDGDETGSHEVYWSCERGSMKLGKWTNGNVSQLKKALPEMPNKGRMIIVETRNTFRRPYNISIGSAELPMDNFVFTHPRVFDQIVNTDPSCQV